MVLYTNQIQMSQAPAWAADLEQRRNSRRPRPPIGHVNVEAQRLRAMQLVDQQNDINGIYPYPPLEFEQPPIRTRSNQLRTPDLSQMTDIMRLLLGIVRRVAGIVLVDPTDEQAMEVRARVRDLNLIDSVPMEFIDDRNLQQSNANVPDVAHEEALQRFQEELLEVEARVNETRRIMEEEQRIERDRERASIEWGVLRINPELSGQALEEAIDRRIEEIRRNEEEFDRLMQAERDQELRNAFGLDENLEELQEEEEQEEEAVRDYYRPEEDNDDDEVWEENEEQEEEEEEETQAEGFARVARELQETREMREREREQSLLRHREERDARRLAEAEEETRRTTEQRILATDSTLSGDALDDSVNRRMRRRRNLFE